MQAVLPDFSEYDLVVVSSPNGARELFVRLAESRQDARVFAGCRVAAIGPGTASALSDHGLRADIVPGRSVAEGLVAALEGVEVRKALVIRAHEGREVLPDALRARGAEVDLLGLYETVPEPLDPETLEAARHADYVTFTAASTVRYFVQAGGSLNGPRLVSIGPATSEALREQGVEPHIEADPHTPQGLVDALVRDATGAT